MLLISARSQTHTQHMHRHYQTCTHTFNMKTQPRLAREVAQTNHSQALLIRGRLGARGCGGGAGVQRGWRPLSPAAHFPPTGPQLTRPSETPDTPFLA